MTPATQAMPARPLIVFAHANSFGAGTYSVLFKALRARGFNVKAIEQFGHDDNYPVTSNWPHLVQQLIAFARTEVDKAGQPAYLVGHSLGGFLSLMAAARAPELARGVVMMDAPILGGWRATTLGVIKGTQLVGSMFLGAVSRKRRNIWPDQAAALAHFQSKKAFAKWDPQVLQDYIAQGTHDEPHAKGTHRVLSFNRDVETAIYNTLPHNLEAMLKRHPVKCPVAFVGGAQSAEMKQFGMGLTNKICKGRLMLLDGGHLFPMERPQATAAAVEAALLNLQSLNVP